MVLLLVILVLSFEVLRVHRHLHYMLEEELEAAVFLACFSPRVCTSFVVVMDRGPFHSPPMGCFDEYRYSCSDVQVRTHVHMPSRASHKMIQIVTI